MKNCLVIGAGPIGSILGAHLLKEGIDVTLVDILKERLRSMEKKGLTVKDPRNQIVGDFIEFPKKFLFSPKEIKEKPDVVFICIKTYYLTDVITEVSQAISTPPKVVVFQNGLDNEEQAAKVFGKENVLRCIINYAGAMTSDTEVEIAFFNRPNHIGVLESGNIPLAKKIAEILTRAGLETEYTDEIKKHEWEKAILNACLASVSTVTGLTMKEVMDSPPLRKIVEKLLLEGIKVAEGTGIKFPDNFYDLGLSYLSKGGYHKPSMLVDIEKGGKTEIDFLNGKIVEYGEKLNIPVPFNWTVTAIIKGLEQKKNRKNKNL
ncbi:MAG: ketopantoate reductase family protein [Candidatus Aminicenantes bacterium]|nr:ketopantoate reductase family protein [Candidatus Aminicenantes bacterium]